MLELKFEKSNVVEKSYTKAAGGGRSQDWEGIKFRAIMSEQGRTKAEAEGLPFEPTRKASFTISQKTYKKLGLDEHALLEYVDNGNVVLLVVTEEEGVFMKKTSRGEKQPSFTNSIMEGHLMEAGVLKNELNTTQFINLEEVSISGAPDYIKAAYVLTAGDSVADDDNEEVLAEEEESFE